MGNLSEIQPLTNAEINMLHDIVTELAPGGTLRAGVNLGNILLVTGETPTGDPVGVSPSMAAAIAEKLGVPVKYVTFKSPGAVADAAGTDDWDIALIADDPERAETIAFCGAYVEIEATYLVPAGSPFTSIEDIDQPGVSIAVSGRSAYDLFLARELKHAKLVRGQGLAGTVKLFVNEKLDVLAGLRPALNEDIKSMPGAKILDGRYTTVQQAIGTKLGNAAAIEFLRAFVTEATQGGLVAKFIEQHGVTGRLDVASGK